MHKSLGQHLQNWLLRNKIDVTHPLFVDSVDHTISNAIRDNMNVTAVKTKRRAFRLERISPSRFFLKWHQR
jgi:hypothetical protein